MAILRIQSSYYVAKDVERLSRFYRDGLGLSAKFSDGPRWSQFAADNGAFALSSISEAAEGAQGGVVVFESIGDSRHHDILRCGGAFIANRDMGSHGAVSTYADPEGNIFQMFLREPSNDSIKQG